MSRYTDAAKRAEAHRALSEVGLSIRTRSLGRTSSRRSLTPLARRSPSWQRPEESPAATTPTRADWPSTPRSTSRPRWTWRRIYRKRYGITGLDRDLIIAAPILHDVMKAWRPPSIEATINHLADYDYVVSEAAAKSVGTALDAATTATAGPDAARVPPEELRWLALQVKTRHSKMALFALLRAGGKPALQDMVRANLLHKIL